MSRRAPEEPASAALLTLEEWADLPEDEPGELIDGILEEEEMADAGHETVVTWLSQQVRNWLRGANGFVLGSEAKYAIRPRRGRKPDLVVFLPGGRVPPRFGLVRVAPDVVVEVISPRPRDQRRDRIEKMADYAELGVRWYWLVDPQLQSFEVFELREGVYAHVRGVTEGVAGDIPGCEGLTLDLPDLWGELERLAQEGTPGEE